MKPSVVVEIAWSAGRPARMPAQTPSSRAIGTSTTMPTSASTIVFCHAAR